jgi:2-keto-4-pentenoate hydratase
MTDANGGTQGKVSSSERAWLRQAAELLLVARRENPLVELPADLRPQSVEDAYVIQDWMTDNMGEIGGWKVGGPKGQTPTCAPIFAENIAANNSLLAGPYHRMRGVEAEVAFCLGKNLPHRGHAYARDEIVAAIKSCNACIEVLESAFVDPDKVDRLSVLADMQMQGAFVHGPAFENWQNIDWAGETVKLSVDGMLRVEDKGSNPGGNDLIALVTWLANEGSRFTDGLKAGQWITTGTWTGKSLASAGSIVKVEFAHAEPVGLRFNEGTNYESDAKIELQMGKKLGLREG